MNIDEETQGKILNHYQRAEGSIQDIARVYRVTVDDVLRIVGEENLGTVETTGDLIDPSEAGPGVQLEYGKQYKVPFTVD